MAQTTQQQQRQRDEEILVALAAAFTAGGGAYVILLTVRNLLTELSVGLPYDVANWLATMASSPLPEAGGVGVPEGPCQVIEAEHAPAWRAMYLVAAAERLREALPTETEAMPTSAITAAKVAEERYFRKHVEAEDRRMRSAALQDMAAKLTEDRVLEAEDQLLNWHAVMDERTTYECAQANGRNFRADRMPVVGWPGAVHVKCRCTAGPAVPGAPLLPSI